MAPLLAAAVLALAALPAQALYKVVGPDGRVTYTDRPPTTAQGAAVPLGPGTAAPAPPEAALPLVLREAVARFPVILYSAADCAPCDAARELLRRRGVPFQERRVGLTEADREALRAATGGIDVPVLTVGQQVLRGFAAETWHGWLDTAGYPRDSLLPRAYAPPPPQPLLDRVAPMLDAAPAPAPTPAPALPPAPAPNAPASRFRF